MYNVLKHLVCIWRIKNVLAVTCNCGVWRLHQPWVRTPIKGYTRVTLNKKLYSRIVLDRDITITKCQCMPFKPPPHPAFNIVKIGIRILTYWL